jgi:hypothetical protein
MRSKDIKKSIDAFAPWYQRYEMEGQFTNKKAIAGERLWPNIRNMIDGKLKKLKILEICSNAGYYSAMMANQRAIVTAVESNPMYVKQAEWTQHFFEQQYNKKIPVNFVKSNPAKLNYKKIDRQHYVLLSSGFKFINKKVDKSKLIENLTSVTDKIIIVSPQNKVAYFNGLFLEHDFFLLRKNIELTPVLLYGRLIKEPIF